MAERSWNHFLFVRVVINFLFYSFFEGWEDAPLADEGIEEAKMAGRNLKKNGFE